jgi:hypothetical protein
MDEFELIPSEQWQDFCQTFSRAHRGWLIRMWVANTASLQAGASENADMVIRDLALQEIASETRGDRTDLVILTRDQDSHVDHSIREIVSITLERDADGAETGLLIESADARSALLRFRTPARPETLDGLAPGETS